MPNSYRISFTGSGVPAIREDDNIDSLVDNATGDFTLNIGTDFASGNYVVAGCGKIADGGFTSNTECIWVPQAFPPLVGSTRINVFAINVGLHDAEVVTVLAHGD